MRPLRGSLGLHVAAHGSAQVLQRRACCPWAEGARSRSVQAPAREPQGMRVTLKVSPLNSSCHLSGPQAGTLLSQDSGTTVTCRRSPASGQRPECQWREPGPVQTCGRGPSPLTAPAPGAAGGTPCCARPRNVRFYQRLRNFMFVWVFFLATSLYEGDSKPGTYSVDPRDLFLENPRSFLR